jgi:hypothetical protein
MMVLLEVQKKDSKSVIDAGARLGLLPIALRVRVCTRSATQLNPSSTASAIIS